MFLKYFGLREQPFGGTPDPRYLYFGSSHREALASLFYGIETGCGFLSLIAPPGMGKTTLLLRLLDRLRGSAQTVFLFQTQCSSREFFRYLLADLGLEHNQQDLASMHHMLSAFLLNNARKGLRFVLLIDEAHLLEDSVLETVRLLSDFEAPPTKLLQIVLCGQPQLADRLVRPHFTQLRQRISIFSRLRPFTHVETMAYIDHRLELAGYSGPPIFRHDVTDLIARHSGGIPRNINNICFSALTLVYAKRQSRVDLAIINEVLEDLNIERPGSNISLPESLFGNSSSYGGPLLGSNGTVKEPYLDASVTRKNGNGHPPIEPSLTENRESSGLPFHPNRSEDDISAVTVELALSAASETIENGYRPKSPVLSEPDEMTACNDLGVAAIGGSQPCVANATTAILEEHAINDFSVAGISSTLEPNRTTEISSGTTNAQIPPMQTAAGVETAQPPSDVSRSSQIRVDGFWPAMSNLARKNAALILGLMILPLGVQIGFQYAKSVQKRASQARVVAAQLHPKSLDSTRSSMSGLSNTSHEEIAVVSGNESRIAKPTQTPHINDISPRIERGRTTQTEGIPVRNKPDENKPNTPAGSTAASVTANIFGELNSHPSAQSPSPSAVSERRSDPPPSDFKAVTGEQVLPIPEPSIPALGTTEAPRLLSSVIPTYPDMAKTLGVSGDVIAALTIDEEGRVADVKVISGPRILIATAVDALRRWKYEPARFNGSPTPADITVTVRFKP